MKQTIFETVSTLRNLFVKLKDSRNGKSNTISELEGRVAKMKAELDECRNSNVKVHGAPSLIVSYEPDRMIAREVTPSSVRGGSFTRKA